MLQDRLEEADTHLRRAIKLLETGRGPQYIVPDVWRSLAELLLRRTPPDVVGANDAGHHSLQRARQAKDQPRAAAALRVLGRVEILKGDGASAVRYLDDAIEIARRLELPLELARSFWEKSLILKDEDPDLSQSLYDEACAIFDARSVPRPEG